MSKVVQLGLYRKKRKLREAVRALRKKAQERVEPIGVITGLPALGAILGLVLLNQLTKGTVPTTKQVACPKCEAWGESDVGETELTCPECLHEWSLA
jgi:hypothetical protein